MATGYATLKSGKEKAIKQPYEGRNIKSRQNRKKENRSRKRESDKQMNKRQKDQLAQNRKREKEKDEHRKLTLFPSTESCHLIKQNIQKSPEINK